MRQSPSSTAAPIGCHPHAAPATARRSPRRFRPSDTSPAAHTDVRSAPHAAGKGSRRISPPAPAEFPQTPRPPKAIRAVHPAHPPFPASPPETLLPPASAAVSGIPPPGAPRPACRPWRRRRSSRPDSRQRPANPPQPSTPCALSPLCRHPKVRGTARSRSARGTSRARPRSRLGSSAAAPAGWLAPESRLPASALVLRSPQSCPARRRYPARNRVRLRFPRPAHPDSADTGRHS